MYQVLLLAVVLVCFSFASKVLAQQLIFNRPVDSPQAYYAIDLLTRAYKPLGYKVHIIDFNHQNALSAANDGILDGQLGRIADIALNYENLLLVEQPLFEFNLVLLKNCHQCQYQQLESVAIQAGYPAAQRYLETHQFDGEIVTVKSLTAQLNLLIQKKVQGIILLDFMLFTKHPQFALHNYHKDTLQPMNSYHFLHKRHKDLLPKLQQQLITLQENGTVRLLKAKYNLP
ncbi:substrate-binding periplasmic protein [Pseudoalteromonas mariniglutinosa]|uniref:substrate-binding periplasmic protein n=1 Tax=Pseudoalteromonas mariniglutinosa TaxID=206042 RepID=UPI003850C1AE